MAPLAMQIQGHSTPSPVDYKLRVLSLYSFILGVGLINIGIGLYARSQSSWMIYDISVVHFNQNFESELGLYNINQTGVKGFQLCQLHNLFDVWGWNEKHNDKEICPDAAIEGFFIATLFGTYLLTISLLLLHWSGLLDIDTLCWKAWSMAHQVLSAILLICAGYLFTFSAHQIYSYAHNMKHLSRDFMYNLLTGEKMLAGILAMVQGCVYSAIMGITMVWIQATPS